MNDESYVPVELKGYRDGLRLIIDSDASIAEIESAIKQRLANLGNSLAGTMVRIEQQNQSLSPQDISHFYSLMQQEYGLESLNAGDEIITMSRLTSSSTEKPILRSNHLRNPDFSWYKAKLSALIFLARNDKRS